MKYSIQYTLEIQFIHSTILNSICCLMHTYLKRCFYCMKISPFPLIPTRHTSCRSHKMILQLQCLGRKKPLYLSDFVPSKADTTVLCQAQIGCPRYWRLEAGSARGRTPFLLHEGQTRGQIKAQMNSFLKAAGIQDGDLLTQSDVDQIPHSQAAQIFLC